MNRVTHRLAQFGALPRAQRSLFMACCAWLPLFWIGLRVLGIARFHAWLLRSRSAPRADAQPEQIQALGDMVKLAARHSPFPATCLTRSLLLQWLLSRRGVASQLRIGVRLHSGSLQAHAWVECDGVPVNDSVDIASQFAPFAASLPAAAFMTP